MAFVTRFAPSPTGPLHLGHAYSALLAHDMARAAGGALGANLVSRRSAFVRSRVDASVSCFVFAASLPVKSSPCLETMLAMSNPRKEQAALAQLLASKLSLGHELDLMDHRLTSSRRTAWAAQSNS